MGPHPYGRGDLIRRPASRERETASMGPRLCGRGKPADKIRVCLIALLQWGHIPKDVETLALHQRGDGFGGASMGPRPCGRGNRFLRFVVEMEQPLQWGRVPTDAETSKKNYSSARRRASMGPRPYGRGDFTKQAQQAGMGVASMGPRPYGRGDSITGKCCFCRQLQGRDRAVIVQVVDTDGNPHVRLTLTL